MLLHQLESSGVDEAAVIEACERAGRPIPKKILDSPELALGLGLFYRAFMQLSSCRSIGMDEGPIPWTAIYTWCEENRVLNPQRRRVFNYVRCMDNAYLKYKAAKIPK